MIRSTLSDGEGVGAVGALPSDRAFVPSASSHPEAVSPLRASIPSAVTHDLSGRVWGRSYEVMKIEGGGERIHIALWATPAPRAGDYALLKQSECRDGKTRYRFDEIEPCGNPRDMAFAWLTYAPRQSDRADAQAIEARRAETQGGSVADESAVGSADVPNPQSTHQDNGDRA